MRYYEELITYQRDGFEIIVDKTYEDISPRGQFEDCDVEEICWKIEHGDYDWFMLRVRVMLDGHEMGSHYLGCCLYEDAHDILTDGTAEDCIHAAMEEAKCEVARLKVKLAEIAV